MQYSSRNTACFATPQNGKVQKKCPTGGLANVWDSSLDLTVRARFWPRMSSAHPTQVPGEPRRLRRRGALKYRETPRFSRNSGIPEFQETTKTEGFPGAPAKAWVFAEFH